MSRRGARLHEDTKKHSSYDDRMQKIARATARILAKAGVDFAIIGKGKDEKDSGHDAGASARRCSSRR